MNPMTFDPVPTTRTLNAMARNPFGYRMRRETGSSPVGIPLEQNGRRPYVALTKARDLKGSAHIVEL
jgi:hypothetical protein